MNSKLTGAGRPVRTLALLVLALALPEPAGKAARAEESPRIGGTFVQLLSAHGDWKPERWAELFGQFGDLGMSEVFVQWTLGDDTAFFVTSNYRTVAQPPLETMLRLADARRMNVFVGLAHDSDFWSKIRRDPVLVEIYLRRLRLRSERLAAELAPLVTRHPSFRGWYVPEEIDDQSWRAPAMRKLLAEHLGALSRTLHAAVPGCEVAVSGFSSGQSHPRALEEFWNALLAAAALDRVLFQDGIGVANLDPLHVGLYLGAVRKAVANRSGKLQVVVEVFRQVGGPPLEQEGPFRAVPAPLDRIMQQIRTAGGFSSLPVVAFSVPDYLSPFGGEEAGRLYRAYLEQWPPRGTGSSSSSAGASPTQDPVR